MELQGSKTEQNLLKAFKGESEARNKYTFYASEAKKAGYIHLSEIYLKTANNEEEHAKIWFKHLNNENIADTISNLNNCIQNELFEHATMYPQYAKEAEEEGFTEIAQHFYGVAKIEGMHKTRFEILQKEILNNTTFRKEVEILWECQNCGYITRSKNAPTKCPVCSHPQGFFYKHNENY